MAKVHLWLADKVHIGLAALSVTLALYRGCKKRSPSFTPHAGEYNRFGRVLGWGIWTPAQVLKFARELQQS